MCLRLLLTLILQTLITHLLLGQIIPDKIHKRNETVIECKVSHKDENNVYYYIIGNEQDIKSISKKQISLIVYSDGNSEIFNIEPDKAPQIKKDREIVIAQPAKEKKYVEPFEVKNKIVIKPGVGLGKVLNLFNLYNPFNSEGWNYIQNVPPISVNLDFGIGNRLSLGPVITVVGYKFEKNLTDTLFSYEVSYFCMGFQAKYYPELKWNRIRPYLRLGLNYYSESHESYIIPKDKTKNVVNMDKDNDIYVGWISMGGIDFMLSSNFGFYAEGGWGTSFGIVGFALKF